MIGSVQPSSSLHPRAERVLAGRIGFLAIVLDLSQCNSAEIEARSFDAAAALRTVEALGVQRVIIVGHATRSKRVTRGNEVNLTQPQPGQFMSQVKSRQARPIRAVRSGQLPPSLVSFQAFLTISECATPEECVALLNSESRSVWLEDLGHDGDEQNHDKVFDDDHEKEREEVEDGEEQVEMMDIAKVRPGVELSSDVT